jgi:hypothetical protein
MYPANRPYCGRSGASPGRVLGVKLGNPGTTSAEAYSRAIGRRLG